MLQMNLLIARNMDRLDMGELSNKDRESLYVDVWIPHHSDATLFLMSYCFSMTSVWRKKGKLRFLSVVPTNDDIDDEMIRLSVTEATPVPWYCPCCDATSALADCNLESLDELVTLFDSQAGRDRCSTH